jgi:MFS family permease
VSEFPRPSAVGIVRRRRLALLIASDAALVGIAIVFAGLYGHGWHWGLFICGLAIGIAGILHTQLALRLLEGALEPDRTEGLRTRLASTSRYFMAQYAVWGVVVGTLCAASDLIWPELALLVFLALCWIGSLLALPVIRRRLETVRGVDVRD